MTLKRLVAAALLLSGLSLAPAGPAQAKWREAATQHFLVYSEESEASLMKFATRLERYDSAIRKARGLPPRDPGPANRLSVYVVANTGAVQRLAGDREDFVVGFYLPRASGSVAFIPRRAGDGRSGDLDAQTVLFHEYAHHFLLENHMAAYPAWFAEGFAEFFSTAKFEDDGGVGLGLPALHRARGLMQGTQLPLAQLLAGGTEKLNTEQRESIYGRGWLLTHYLAFDPKRAGQTTKYLEALNSGKTGLDAAKAAFGDLDQLDRELESYLRRSRLSYLKIAPEAIATGPIAIRELGPGEDALMPVKLRSKRGVNAKYAQAVLADARRLAAPFATDPAVQATLAEAEYDARNYKEAEAATDRALAADPGSIDALTYKAMAKMRLAEASTDAEVWKEIRRILGAANRIDPDDPQPLILFYESFRRQGIAPTANAVQGLYYAFELAPQDRSLRAVAGRQYLADGKLKEARAALAPLAFDPHAGPRGKAMAALIALIDSGLTAEALKEWNRIDQAPGGGS